MNPVLLALPNSRKTSSLTSSKLHLGSLVGEREISTEGVDPDCVKGSSRKSATRDDARNGGKETAAEKTGSPVDRAGRPDVHDVHSVGAVDRTGRPKQVSVSR